MRGSYILLGITSLVFICCSADETMLDNSLSDIPYLPEAYNLQVPTHFPQMPIPTDNPLTVDGVRLGRHLFYDPILSRDSTLSCASCHHQQSAFTDNEMVSEGVDGTLGRRSSMSLIDIGFHTNGFFWDGRTLTLEEQAEIPVEDPVEMHEMWGNVEKKFQRHKDYPILFRKAFGIEEKIEITKELAVKAIAQFERTLVSSGTAKYDRVVAGTDVFTDEELKGHNIFFDIEDDISRHAECGHCHNAPLFTITTFANNGIDNVDEGNLLDKGLAEFTNVDFDNGKFKITTLRNIFNTAPYMHDGRFSTIDEVLDHYISGGHASRNLDPVLRPLNIGEEDRAALKAFIGTLQDEEVLNDLRYASPFN
ncbi:MAG: cytochrome c peroxidase [Saprospiraceae bacterium]|jgi:cytochrome c peroxidase